MASVGKIQEQGHESISRDTSPALNTLPPEPDHDATAADNESIDEEGHSDTQGPSGIPTAPTNKTRRLARVKANAERNAANSKRSGNPKATAGKKPKQRRELDVMNRMRWDETFNTADVIIGYEDRHSESAIIEIPFDDWERESTADEFIPLHRIRYFRRVTDGQVLWHRALRIDEVFAPS